MIALIGTRNSSVNSSLCAILSAISPTPKAMPARIGDPVASRTMTIAMIPSATSMPPNNPVTTNARHVRVNRSAPAWAVLRASSTSASSAGASEVPCR